MMMSVETARPIVGRTTITTHFVYETATATTVDRLMSHNFPYATRLSYLGLDSV